MSSGNDSIARRHLAGLALANEFEIQELRQAPVELKLRQLWALMRSMDVMEDPSRREAESRIVRERWNRFYQTRNV
jgi:hypothetical protein